MMVLAFLVGWGAIGGVLLMMMRVGAWRRGAMMMMGWRWMIAGVMLCGCGEKRAVEEKAAKVVVERVPMSLVSSFRAERVEAEWDPEVLFSSAVVWASESMVVVTSRNGRVQAFDVKSGEEIWKVEYGKNVGAIACSKRHVYVALESMPVTPNREWLWRVEIETGKDDTPPAIPQPGISTALVWNEELEQLCVLEVQAVSLYSRDLMSVKKRIPVDGMMPFGTSDGESILLSQMGGNCRVVDVKAGTLEYLYGPPSMKSGEWTLLPDSPDRTMQIDAFYDAREGRLIRNVDTKGGQAQLFFHESPGSEARVVETGNDHAKSAVHWPTGRLAAAGTSKNLMLYSTKGDVIAEEKDAVSATADALAFSPSGKQVAVLDEEGWVKVYEVP